MIRFPFIAVFWIILFCANALHAQAPLSRRDSMEVALAQELDNRGFSHYLRGEYDQALPFALKTLKLYKKLKLDDKTPLGQANVNTAIIYANLYQLKKASKHLEKGIKIYESMQPPTHPNMATALEWRKKIEAAELLVKEKSETQ